MGAVGNERVMNNMSSGRSCSLLSTHLQHPWAGVQVSVQPDAGFWKPSIQILQSGPIELPVHMTRKLTVIMVENVPMRVTEKKSLPEEIFTEVISVSIPRLNPGSASDSVGRTRKMTPYRTHE